MTTTSIPTAPDSAANKRVFESVVRELFLIASNGQWPLGLAG
jgi:hypothetical protein